MALTSKSFQGLKPYWSSLTDHPEWLQKLLPRVVEARRKAEKRELDPGNYGRGLLINGQKLEELFFRDGWLSNNNHRTDDLQKNIRSAINSVMLLAWGQRCVPSPGVSWDQNRSSGCGTKADYMIGAPFRQPKLDPRNMGKEEDGPMEMLYVLEDTVQWGFWKVQPLEKHESNAFMYRFYEIGEGGYDTITVPFEILIKCQDFSDAYLLDFGREGNPIMEWLRADWLKVREAVAVLEDAALAKAEEAERKEFCRLLRKFGPEIVKGNLGAEEIMQDADSDRYYYWHRFLSSKKIELGE